MNNLPQRMWINQPATTQEYHALHGSRVLAVAESETTYRIYFLSGDVVSQQIPRRALEEGWTNNTVNTSASKQRGESLLADMRRKYLHARDKRNDASWLAGDPITAKILEHWIPEVEALVARVSDETSELQRLRDVVTHFATECPWYEWAEKARKALRAPEET